MLPAEEFANTSTGCALVSPPGQWLGGPTGVLYASEAGTTKAVLLQLSSPRYNAVEHKLTFKVRADCGLVAAAGKRPCILASTARRTSAEQ